MTPASSNLSDSEKMNSKFSLLCMGRAFAFTANLCPITSLGTPGKPDASHAKTSEFSQRKATSVLSYLSARWAPMVMVREPSLVSATFLVICRSPWNGAFLEEVDAEPQGYPPSPENALDRKSTRLNSSHRSLSRMPSSA